MLLIMGGYGLLIMTGFVAINRTRPHVLNHHQVRLRCGLFADITLAPTDIASVASARHSCGYRPAITHGVLIMPDLPPQLHPKRAADVLQHHLPQDRVPPPAPAKRPRGHRAVALSSRDGRANLRTASPDRARRWNCGRRDVTICDEAAPQRG